MVEKTFTVEGIDGEEGEMLIEAGLASLEGVDEVEADSMMDMVVVNYDPDLVTLQDMQELMDELGFDLLPR